MSMMNDDCPGRKRIRSGSDDDISEFTPLSKRINNLHINNSFFSLLKDNASEEEQTFIDESAEKRVRSYEEARGVDRGGMLRNSWTSLTYSPDLTPAENPYYYESNRLLFALHVERINRSSSSSSSF